MITLCRSPEIERLLSSREFSLLARCSVWPLKEEQVYAIQKAAAPPIEWGHFMALVHRHRVARLVHENIGHAGISLPPDTRSKIAALARMIASENVGLIAESNRLQKSFRDADVEFLFLKGVSLARLAYTNVGVRHIRDIDILVTPSKIELAHLVLSKAGYNPYQPPSAFSPASASTFVSQRLSEWPPCLPEPHAPSWPRSSSLSKPPASHSASYPCSAAAPLRS